MTLTGERRELSRRFKRPEVRDRAARPMVTACDAAWTMAETQREVRAWLICRRTAEFRVEMPGMTAVFVRERRLIDGTPVHAAVDAQNRRTVYACAPRG